MAKEIYIKRHCYAVEKPTSDLTSIGQGDGGPNSIERFFALLANIQEAINDGTISGVGFQTIQQDKALIVGVEGISYSKPESLGSAASLIITKWGDIKGVTIYVKNGEDYDESNDFVLNITDLSQDSNDWDMQSSAQFNLYIPQISVNDGTDTPLGVAQVNNYETSVLKTWSANILTLTFNGSNFKAKSVNTITIT